MAIQTFKRYELKFMLTRAQYEQINTHLSAHMEYDKNCKDGKCYTIYNLYFDTETDEIIRRSIEKPYYKEKLRLRAYQIPTDGKSEVFLELKKKINGIVAKRRAVLDYDEAIDFITKGIRPHARSYQDSQVFDEIEVFLSRYKVYPKVYISYERNAFFGKEDKEFRVSFDKNILTRRDAVNFRQGDYGQSLLDDEMYLMEVKCSGSIPLWLTNLLSEMKVYKRSFSKYGTEYRNQLTRKRNKVA